MSQNENAAPAAETPQLRPMDDTEAEKIVGGSGSGDVEKTNKEEQTQYIDYVAGSNPRGEGEGG